MNVAELNNNQPVNNHLEISNPSFSTRVFNKVVQVIKSEPFVAMSTYTIINMGTLSISHLVSDSVLTGLKVNALICPPIAFVAAKIIESIYMSRGLADIEVGNNRNVREQRQEGQGGRWKIAGARIAILNISYDELPVLPANYGYYDNSGICSITWEPLEAGDAVCCDKKLYSFKALKEYYIKYNGREIPHSRNIIDWQCNVYRVALQNPVI